MISRSDIIDLYKGRNDLTPSERVIAGIAARATDLPRVPNAQVQLPERDRQVRVRPGCWSVPFELTDDGETIELLALAYCAPTQCLMSVFLETPRGAAVYPMMIDQHADAYCLHDVPSPMNRERVSWSVVQSVFELAQAAVSAACTSILDAPESEQ